MRPSNIFRRQHTEIAFTAFKYVFRLRYLKLKKISSEVSLMEDEIFSKRFHYFLLNFHWLKKKKEKKKWSINSLRYQIFLQTYLTWTSYNILIENCSLLFSLNPYSEIEPQFYNLRASTCTLTMSNAIFHPAKKQYISISIYQLVNDIYFFIIQLLKIRIWTYMSQF